MGQCVFFQCTYWKNQGVVNKNTNFFVSKIKNEQEEKTEGSVLLTGTEQKKIVCC